VLENGICDPGEGSPAWCMIQLFRPGVEKAVERATAYHERMSAAWRKMMGGAAQGASDAQPTAPEPAAGMTPPSAPTPASPDLVRGRLRCGSGFEVVTVDGVAYNLHKRPKARLCIQYLFENEAFDAVSARHLVREIDPFVRERGGFPRAAEIKIQHYFNGPKGKLPQLCKQLIAGVHGKGRYFLKVE
jgi:hypothetical protein